MLLPPRCVLCREVDRPLCAVCAVRLPPAGDGVVPALFAYEGDARRLVAALKHHHARRLLPVLGRALAARLPSGVEAVTWAPTSPSRRRARGYDQAELLARAVARELGCPARRLLARAERGQAQMGRPRAERLSDPPRFVAVGRLARHVALVDDVVTTGATLRAAEGCLRAAGVRRVSPVVVAAAGVQDLGPARASGWPSYAAATVASVATA